MSVKNINTILSNPKGSGIHSPFAFELVSGVLFPLPHKTWWSILLSDLGIKKPGSKFEAILRMAEFLNYSRVAVTGANPNEWYTALMNADKNLPLEIFKASPAGLTGKREVVIWTDPPTDETLNKGAVDSVWIIDGIEQKRSLLCFRKLTEDSRVTQSFRMNTLGLIIFNERFQKENFVIKGKNAY